MIHYLSLLYTGLKLYSGLPCINKSLNLNQFNDGVEFELKTELFI